MGKDKKENNTQDDTIIEMQQVDKAKKISKFNLISMILSALSLSLVIMLIIWINYFKFPSFFSMKYKEFEKINKNIDDKFDKFSVSTKQNSNAILSLDAQIKNLNQDSQVLNYNKLKNKILELEKNNQKLFEKLQLIKKQKDFVEIKQPPPSIYNENDNHLNVNNLDGKEKVKTGLLNEFDDLKKVLFNKKHYTTSDQNDDNSFFEMLINYFSGFFNLRDYRENSNPRSLLAKAEKSALNGDLKKTLYYLNQLPDEWKKEILGFIQKSEKFLNSES